MTKLFDSMTATPVVVVWRHAKSIATGVAIVWGSIWWVGGDYVKAQAEDRLVEMLADQGMAPDDIKLMKQKIDDVSRDLEKVGTDTANTSRTIAAVSRDVDKLQEQLEAINKQSDRTYDLLKTLLPLMKSEGLAP